MVLKMAEGHRTRPRTRATAHFARTGCILPGHAGEVAAFLKRRRQDHEQRQEVQHG